MQVCPDRPCVAGMHRHASMGPYTPKCTHPIAAGAAANTLPVINMMDVTAVAPSVGFTMGTLSPMSACQPLSHHTCCYGNDLSAKGLPGVHHVEHPQLLLQLLIVFLLQHQRLLHIVLSFCILLASCQHI